MTLYFSALLELSQPIDYTFAIKPICLPKADVRDNQLCITSGWGDTQGQPPFKLKKMS